MNVVNLHPDLTAMIKDLRERNPNTVLSIQMKNGETWVTWFGVENRFEAIGLLEAIKLELTAGGEEEDDTLQ